MRGRSVIRGLLRAVFGGRRRRRKQGRDGPGPGRRPAALPRARAGGPEGPSGPGQHEPDRTEGLTGRTEDATNRAERLSGSAERAVKQIQEAFGHSVELVARTFRTARGRAAAAVYINGLVSTPSIAHYIIAPLSTDRDADEPVAAEKEPVRTLREAIQALTSGKCVLLLEGSPAAAFDVRSWAMRSVDQSEVEPSETGPVESFVEDLSTNIVLIRRRLRTENLQTERIIIGRESRTDVRIVYLRGIVRDALVEEVRSRLKKIDVDTPFDVHFLEEMTTDTPWSPFPGAMTTVRPDRVAAMLTEGHVAVLIDGTPMVMIVPGTLAALLQAADDYYSNYYVASFTRVIRWIAGLIGLMASSLYVAVISYHHELIPSRLLFTIAAAREGVPFPPIIEALLMELAFELLREAGLRVPRQIGQALSIVGVLVIGDAAVRAGLVSPLMIVIVGISAISTFAIPSAALADTVRLLRFPIILLAGVLGLFAVTFGLLLIMGLLIASRSYGVPYLTPFLPVSSRGLRDAMLRMPMWLQWYRPWQMVNPGRRRQQAPGQMPRPEPEEV